MRIHNVFQVSLLKPVSSDPLPDQHPPLPPPVVVDEEGEYLVEELLDSRVWRRRLEFLVKWLWY
jgi:hypothetical protein